MEESREFNRSLCRIAADLSGVGNVSSRIALLTEAQTLLSDVKLKATKTTSERLDPLIKHLALSDSPVVARIATTVLCKLSDTNEHLIRTLSKSMADISIREVQLMHAIVVSCRSVDFPVKMFLKQLGTAKVPVSSPDQYSSMLSCYLRFIDGVFSLIGPVYVAGLSKTVFRGLILPLAKSTCLPEQVLKSILSLSTNHPLLLQTPRAIPELFDVLPPLGLLTASLRSAETAGVPSARLHAKDLARWLEIHLKRALTTLQVSKDAIEAGELLAALADSGWLDSLTAGETKQVLGTCVALLKKSGKATEHILKRFILVPEKPVHVVRVPVWTQLASEAVTSSSPSLQVQHSNSTITDRARELNEVSPTAKRLKSEKLNTSRDLVSEYGAAQEIGHLRGASAQQSIDFKSFTNVELKTLSSPRNKPNTLPAYLAAETEAAKTEAVANEEEPESPCPSLQLDPPSEDDQ